MTTDVVNRKWSVDELLAVRRNEVLPQWRTDLGPLDRYFERHRGLAPRQRADMTMRTAKEASRVVVQPRHGEALIDSQIRAMQDLLGAGAEVVSTLTDPYTRQLRFDLADAAYRESVDKGRSLISGFPIASYGAARASEIVDGVEGPCSVRMASSDPRLAKELYLAAGYTAMFMGAVQNLAYEKQATPEELIRHYQYEDRLIGLYEENGCPIVKELPSTLTGTLVPPCIALTSTLIDTLLAVEQGVRRVVCSYGLLGNYVQDIAAVRALRQLAHRRIGAVTDDIEVYVVTPQWMGDFPQHEDEAFAVIVEGSLLAARGGTDMVISKSPDEGFGVPSHEANVAGVVATRAAVNLVANQPEPSSPELDEEVDRITRSVDAILDAVVRLGKGDLARGTAAAIRSGVIDVPFSPSLHSANKAMPARDIAGAVRWLDSGNVPLPGDVIAFHRQSMAERARAADAKAGYQFLVDDIVEFSRKLGPRADARGPASTVG